MKTEDLGKFSEKLEKFRKEVGGRIVIMSVFGEYDYIVEITRDNIDLVSDVVNKFRNNFSEYLIQTITVIERRMQ
jgi:hypothetical protein